MSAAISYSTASKGFASEAPLAGITVSTGTPQANRLAHLMAEDDSAISPADARPESEPRQCWLSSQAHGSTLFARFELFPTRELSLLHELQLSIGGQGIIRCRDFSLAASEHAAGCLGRALLESGSLAQALHRCLSPEIAAADRPSQVEHVPPEQRSVISPAAPSGERVERTYWHPVLDPLEFLRGVRTQHIRLRRVCKIPAFDQSVHCHIRFDPAGETRAVFTTHAHSSGLAFFIKGGTIERKIFRAMEHFEDGGTEALAKYLLHPRIGAHQLPRDLYPRELECFLEQGDASLSLLPTLQQLSAPASKSQRPLRPEPARITAPSPVQNAPRSNQTSLRESLEHGQRIPDLEKKVFYVPEQGLTYSLAVHPDMSAIVVRNAQGGYVSFVFSVRNENLDGTQIFQPLHRWRRARQAGRIEALFDRITLSSGRDREESLRELFSLPGMRVRVEPAGPRDQENIFISHIEEKVREIPGIRLSESGDGRSFVRVFDDFVAGRQTIRIERDSESQGSGERSVFQQMFFCLDQAGEGYIELVDLRHSAVILPMPNAKEGEPSAARRYAIDPLLEAFADDSLSVMDSIAGVHTGRLFRNGYVQPLKLWMSRPRITFEVLPQGGYRAHLRDELTRIHQLHVQVDQNDTLCHMLFIEGEQPGPLRSAVTRLRRLWSGEPYTDLHRVEVIPNLPEGGLPHFSFADVVHAFLRRDHASLHLSAMQRVRNFMEVLGLHPGLRYSRKASARVPF